MSTDLRAKLFIFAFLFTLTIIGFSFYDFCLLNFKKVLEKAGGLWYHYIVNLHTKDVKNEAA